MALTGRAFAVAAILAVAPGPFTAPVGAIATPFPATPGPAGPQGPGPDAPLVDPAPGQGLSNAVAALELTSPEMDAAERERDGLVEKLRSAEDRRSQIEPELATLRVELRSLEEILERRTGQIDKAQRLHAAVSAAVNQVAVEWFITGFGALEGLDPALTAGDRERLERQSMLARSGAGAVLRDRDHLSARLDSLRSERAATDESRARVAERVRALEDELAQLTTAQEDARRRLPAAEERVRIAAMSARVAGTDLTALAVDAYWRAERVLAFADPRCGVSWWVLAGIGRTESHHGTYRGATVSLTGQVSPPIYGPYLDGSNLFAVVRDSDRGALDGTARTDRAVGPMQFLPSTWKMVGTDADGDGVADPQNLFDAALSAGVYLCRSGPALTEESRLRRSLFTYNRSSEYVQIVIDRGLRYRDATSLSR